jgi:ribokinase
MITTAMVDVSLACFEPGDMLVLQNEINLLDYIIDEAYARGMKIVFNPSPFDCEIEKCKLDKVSIFVLNEIEAQHIAQAKDIDLITKAMRDLYPKAQTVITLGERGAVCFDKQCLFSIEAQKADVVDTTAAGDTFTGYFIAAIAKGEKPETALKQATIAAGISVTRKGAAPSIPYRTEINC